MASTGVELSLLAYSNCFNDNYNVLAVIAVINLIVYLFVCLPDNQTVIKSVLAINFSFIVVAILQSHFPSTFPDDIFALIGIYIGFASVFIGLIGALDDIAYVFLGMLITGPLFYSMRNGLSRWLSDHIGISLSDVAAAFVCLFLTVFVALIWVGVSNSHRIALIVKSIAFGIIAAVSIHFLDIKWQVSEFHGEFCCSSPDLLPTTKTCPILMSWGYITLFFVMSIVRLILDVKWQKRKEAFSCLICLTRCVYGKRKKKKKKKEKEEEKLNNNKEEEENKTLIDEYSTDDSDD